MSTGELLVETAPVERLPKEKIIDDAKQILKSQIMRRILDIVPDPCVILNGQRQIVFANRVFRHLVNEPELENILGLRPGEAVGCAHSEIDSGGCGTTEFCRVCGALKAILSSQQGIADTQECHILRKKGDALDLHVWASPIELEGKTYSFFAIQDKSNEKRRRMLERIFFHDVLNTVGSLYSYTDLLYEACPQEGNLGMFAKTVFQLSQAVIDEIQAQKELLAAENFELVTKPEPVDSVSVLNEIIDSYKNHAVAKHKTLVVDKDSKAVAFITDRTLLKRVIGNMTKNALEASKTGEQVTLGCGEEGGEVVFKVHNPGYMPYETQLQIFKHSFSTKGAGRGLGTYSIKLLTERYLKGTVSFTTSQQEGTTFFTRYPMNIKERQ